MRSRRSLSTLRAWALSPLLAGLVVALAACAAGQPGSPTPSQAPAALQSGPGTNTPQSRATDTPAPTATATFARAAVTQAETAIATPAVTPAATATPTVAAAPAVATWAAAPRSAQELSTVRLALQPVAEGLAAPLFVTHAGDGTDRLFVVDKPGMIRIVAAGGLVAEPFLDTRDRIGSRGSEQGLLGLAFAPDYAASGRLFVNYTDRNGDTVVARFDATADPNAADPGSEMVVLRIEQPAPNHNGGMLAFGPDGYLYIGTGDGGSANDRFRNGQNPGTLLGKMLRIDVTGPGDQPYAVPADNPWVQADWNGRPVLDETWAVGLRNPWRYSFDRVTGDLWIADVGQNLYEEVNRVPAGSPGGLNFGWPIMEGTHCFPESAACRRTGLEVPVQDYAHGENGCSITGGYVYRGQQYPALQGVYLYGDFCSGKIWGLVAEGDRWRSVELLDSGLSISSFGEDAAGEVYVTDLRGGGVYRVEVR